MPLDNFNDENEKRHFSTDSLEELLQTVKDRRERVQDFIAPTNKLQQRTTVLEGGGVRTDVIREAFAGAPTAILEANPVARSQIASKAGIEARTAERLRSNYSEQYDGLINAIWEKEPKKVTLRTYEHDSTQHESMVRDGLGSALVSQNTGILRAVVPTSSRRSIIQTWLGRLFLLCWSPRHNGKSLMLLVRSKEWLSVLRRML